MGKYEWELTEKKFVEDKRSVEGIGLSQTGAARRRFLSHVARWTGAIAVVTLGTETVMQVVPRRSLIANAVAEGSGTRNRQLHPFPSDDPFNMPLGRHAWYAPADDPATNDFIRRTMHITVNNGWSHPIFFPSTADPIHTFWHRRGDECSWRSCRMESYRPEEHGAKEFQEHLQQGANTISNIEGRDGFWDDHLHIIIGNDLVELYAFRTPEDSRARVSRGVRNQLDHYSFSRYAFSNPLANTAGTRAYGGVGPAGLIRKHEVDNDHPHIPHALAIAGHRRGQAGTTDDGDPSSPLFKARAMFPANNIDSGGYARWYSKCWTGGAVGSGELIDGCTGEGNFRMGMRFALDPTIATDAWIEANAPNKWAAAIAYAMRDYGCMVTDTSLSSNIFYGEEGISTAVETAMRDGLNFMRPAVRRVAGAGPLHNPGESDWESWRAASEGWGGGAPRVPYSPPLSSAVREQSPGAPPQSPVGINVTESRKFWHTA